MIYYIFYVYVLLPSFTEVQHLLAQQRDIQYSLISVFLGQIFRYLVIFLRLTIFHHPEKNTKMMSNIIVLQYNIILDGDDSLKLSARKM